MDGNLFGLLFGFGKKLYFLVFINLLLCVFEGRFCKIFEFFNLVFRFELVFDLFLLFLLLKV